MVPAISTPKAIGEAELGACHLFADSRKTRRQTGSFMRSTAGLVTGKGP